MKTVLKQIIVVAIVALTLISLSAWTLTSPTIMLVQSESQISNSILQYANFLQNVSFEDGSGSYVFKFGVDYDKNISQGQPVILAVYVALLSEDLSSSFTRGIAIRLGGASILVDGSEISGVKVRSTYSSDIASFYLTYIRINSSLGSHELTAHLIINIVDINFVGYFFGTSQPVNLNETVEVV